MLLPMPGSPPSSVTEPATSPPPSTRSSSGIDVVTGLPCSVPTSPSRVGPGRFDRTATSALPVTSTSSTSVFQSPHPAHRPAHFGCEVPHSLQTWTTLARLMPPIMTRACHRVADPDAQRPAGGDGRRRSTLAAPRSLPAGDGDVADEQRHEDDPGDQRDQGDDRQRARPPPIVAGRLDRLAPAVEDRAVERNDPLQSAVVEFGAVGLFGVDLAGECDADRRAHRRRRCGTGRLELVGERQRADGGDQVLVGECLESVGQPEQTAQLGGRVVAGRAAHHRHLA